MKWQVYAISLCYKSPGEGNCIQKKELLRLVLKQEPALKLKWNQFEFVQLVSGTNSVAARSRKTAIIVYVTYFPCRGNVLSELLLTDVFLVLFRLQLVFSLVMNFF